MKYFFPLLLMIPFSGSFAQFAIIQDEDGFSNVRKTADTTADVLDKLNNGKLVYCYQTKGNWKDIGYTKNNRDQAGYVYQDRLKMINDYQILKLVSNAERSATCGQDSLSVLITLGFFDKTRNKLSYHKESKSQIELVNGSPFWGTDGELPHSLYKSIVIVNKQQKLILPAMALANLFEPRLSSTQVNYDRVNDIIYIQSANSDGAGFYQVIWKIEKGVYKERYVAAAF